MKSDPQINPRRSRTAPALPLAVSRLLVAAAALAVCITACGCGYEAPGTQLVLGPVSYDKAFVTAREVLAQYFSLEEVDPEAGVIRSRPRFIEASGFSISDLPPARQLADLKLRPDGQYVVARLTVAVQRQGSEAYRTFRSHDEDYSGMGGRTPADLEGATTRRQNELWETHRYDHMLERTILRDLARLLEPVGQAPPK